MVYNMIGNRGKETCTGEEVVEPKVECERGGEFGTEDCWLDEDHMRISYCEAVGDAAPENNSFGDEVAE